MEDNSKNFRDDKSRIPTEAELEAMLDEESDEEFGQTESEVASSDQKAVLREWNAQDFAAIYTRFRPHLERHARRFLRNPSQVDEVVQDAFLYLMVTLPELDSELGVLRFLKWKVRLLALDVIRANGKVYHADLEEHQDSIASEDPEMDLELERAEDAAIVRLALAKLQPRHREVLIASIYEEKSTFEIAEQVGLTENATRQLMLRARLSLRRALVGEVDTRDMSLSQILSVAAKKAAYEAKNAGIQTLSVIAIAVLGVAAFLNFGGFGAATQIAEPAPTSQQASPAPQAETEPAPGESAAPAEAPEGETSGAIGAESEISNSETTNAALASDATQLAETVAETVANETAPAAESTAEPVQQAMQLALTDSAVDRSPFDPWVVDPIFEQGGQADMLLSSAANPDIFTKSQYAAISDAGIWADFAFKADGVIPISDVRVGFVAQSEQYFAITRKLDYLVGRTASGLDRYVYIGEIREIVDLNNVAYTDTRMDGVRITLEVLVDPIRGKVVESLLFAQQGA